MDGGVTRPAPGAPLACEDVISRVLEVGRLEQHDLDFIVGDRPMLRATRRSSSSGIMSKGGQARSRSAGPRSSPPMA
jgi:hypothetical protein